jgi:hypothetical protein
MLTHVQHAYQVTWTLLSIILQQPAAGRHMVINRVGTTKGKVTSNERKPLISDDDDSLLNNTFLLLQETPTRFCQDLVIVRLEREPAWLMISSEPHGFTTKMTNLSLVCRLAGTKTWLLLRVSTSACVRYRSLQHQRAIGRGLMRLSEQDMR